MDTDVGTRRQSTLGVPEEACPDRPERDCKRDCGHTSSCASATWTPPRFDGHRRGDNRRLACPKRCVQIALRSPCKRHLSAQRAMKNCLQALFAVAVSAAIALASEACQDAAGPVRVDLTVRIVGEGLPNLAGYRLLVVSPLERRVLWFGSDGSAVAKDFPLTAIGQRVGLTGVTFADLPDPALIDHMPDGSPIPRFPESLRAIDSIVDTWPDRTLGWRIDRSRTWGGWIPAATKRTGPTSAEATIEFSHFVRARLLAPPGEAPMTSLISSLRGNPLRAAPVNQDGSRIIELPRGMGNILWDLRDNWLYETAITAFDSKTDFEIESPRADRGERVSMQRFELLDGNVNRGTGLANDRHAERLCSTIEAMTLDGRSLQVLGSGYSREFARDNIPLWMCGRIGSKSSATDEPAYEEVRTGEYLIVESNFPIRGDSFESTWTIMQGLREGFDLRPFDLPTVKLTKGGAPAMTLDAPKLRAAMDAAAAWIRACRDADRDGKPRPPAPARTRDERSWSSPEAVPSAK
ncbi:MAG: hypothetical protein U0572_14335 [Phycisphaerales bacterium]